MTGEDVKQQVLEYGALTPGLKAALAPCVVLTPEEREKVWAWCARWATPHDDEGRREVLALLTPDEAGDE